MSVAEQMADRLSGGALTELREAAQQQGLEVERLTESLRLLEIELQAEGWRRLAINSEQEFTREGLRRIMEICRIMRLKNPIIQRGVQLKRLYTWARGVTIRAKDEELNEVIQSFLDDERNRAEMTGHQARGEAEEALQTDGNIFIRLFPDATSGRVRVALIDPQEISEIIPNPENRREPFFYKRMYTQQGLDGRTKTITEYYPDWQYIPQDRPLLDKAVDWATPVIHLADNRLGLWGIPRIYAAVDWAKAYKDFLENLATVWQALARFAWKINVAGGKRGVAAAKDKLNTRLTGLGGRDGNPPPLAGSTFIGSGETDLTPMRTGGVTMEAEDGRRLFLMAVAVMGFPETFYGDASVGTLATARSLDRPTELMVIDRQTLWADLYRGLLEYALLWAVKATDGKLRGAGLMQREADGDQWLEYVAWHDDVDATIDIEFPPITESDMKAEVDALIDITTLKGSAPAGTLDLQTFTRLAATALGVRDVDALIDELFDPDGETAVTDGDDDREDVIEAVRQTMAHLREALYDNGKADAESTTG